MAPALERRQGRGCVGPPGLPTVWPLTARVWAWARPCLWPRAFASGWAAAEFGLCLAAAPDLGPRGQARVGRSSLSGELRDAGSPGPAADPRLVCPWADCD